MEASTDFEGRILLPSLKTLRIVVSYLELRDQLCQTNDSWMGLEVAMMQTLGLADKEIKVVAELGQKQKMHQMLLRTLIDTNMSVLLKSLRSPVLQSLYILIDWLPQFGFEARQFDWKFSPLESFIAAHRKTLRKLHLPNLGGKETMVHQERLLPEKLESLELSLSREAHQERQSYEFWEKLLLGQECLKELHLDWNVCQGELWYKGPLLGVLLEQNHSSLTFINISTSDPGPGPSSINGSIFKSCTALRTLLIQETSFPSQVLNLPGLPKSLVRLQIHPVSVLKTMEWEQMRNFGALKILHLRNIFRTDQFTDYIKVNRFFKEVLRLRHLQSLKLHFEQPFEGTERTKVLIKLFQNLRGRMPEPEAGISFIVMTPAEVKWAALVRPHFFELNSTQRAKLGGAVRVGETATNPDPDLALSDLLVESNVFQKETGVLGSLINSLILNS
jgi:hypothetical protein